MCQNSPQIFFQQRALVDEKYEDTFFFENLANLFLFLCEPTIHVLFDTSGVSCHTKLIGI